MSRTFAISLLLCLATTWGRCSDDAAQPAANPPLPTISIQYEGGVLTAEIARTAQERELGLGGRPALAREAGMLFDLGSVTLPSFWMKGMQFPLDLLFIEEDGRIASITPDVQPEPGVADASLRRYSPLSRVRFVLELNAGTAARLGLDPGERLLFRVP